MKSHSSLGDEIEGEIERVTNGLTAALTAINLKEDYSTSQHHELEIGEETIEYLCDERSPIHSVVPDASKEKKVIEGLKRSYPLPQAKGCLIYLINLYCESNGKNQGNAVTASQNTKR